MTVQQAFELALQRHQSGQLAEAELLYRQILAVEPLHADALHLLGVIAHQMGQNGVAVELILQAIAQAPKVSDYHSNLGEACRANGQLGRAIAACRQAIALQPDFAMAHSNLGNALKDNGQLDEAIVAYRQALALKPSSAETHSNLGAALYANGRQEDAMVAFRQAIAFDPKFAKAHANLGVILYDKGQLEEAAAAFRWAIALKPSFAEAHNNFGRTLRDQGQLDEATAAFRQAIALNPGLAEAHSNLGGALVENGRLDEAIASCRQAIALKPGLAEAYSNLGGALRDSGQLDEAIAAFRQAVALKPGFSEAYGNLLFTLNYHPGYDGCAIAAEAARWERQHAEPARPFIRRHCNGRDPGRRLRVGYVSPDFRDHPVGRFMLPLLAHHDREDFEIFCYAQVPCADAMTRRLRGHAEHWHSLVGLTDPQVAELIRQHGIDILVDLALHTAGNRLLVFARKPAPVQVTYLAYAGSSGLRTMDYRLSDPHLDPPGADEAAYSEQTFRLPGTYWCYQPPEVRPAVPLREPGASGVTFGCLNSFCKVNEATIGTWARLLEAVPGGQLLLHAGEGSHRGRAAGLFGRLGVDPRRVRFVSKVPASEYLRLYGQVDVALDPFPYGGGTTTCDALWMGVPVVSLRGDTAVGRAGVSLLSNTGLSDLVAQTRGEYVRIAAALAGDRPRLTHLRATLRQRMEQSPLMDAPRFARDIEAAYRQMWRRWCEMNA